ncbi:hypothetical protein PISMIDRAFT_118541, partial [Pisolithus microcarpus 441]
VTVDNASNNNMMMIAIEGELRRCGIPFHRDGNWLRWYRFSTEQYCNMTGTVHSIVSVCHASGQCHQDFGKVIVEGNLLGRWAGKLPDSGDKLLLYQLLHDCETHWSSTFLMIECLLLLYPVCVSPTLDELECYHLTKDKLNVLRDIHQVLEIPHSAQEALSAECTPTLSMALPVYELLIQKWMVLTSQTIPELSHHINIALQKLQNYVREACKTCIYALAMIVNPDMKFEWMQQYWELQDVANTQKWILEAVKGIWKEASSSESYMQKCLIYCGSHSSKCNFTPNFNQCQHLSVLCLIEPPSRTSTPTTSNPPCIVVMEVLTGEDLAAYNAQALAEDQKDAEHELEQYEHEQMTHSMGTWVTDLVHDWEQSETLYPLLFHVAMDILLAQASAVPCEFMEALQILKFSIWGDHLSFTADLLACEEDYDISSHLTVHAINELVETGKFNELNELAANAQDDWDLDNT